MNTEKRIFLTGATGFVGGYILQDLIRRGYTRITALMRETSDLAMVRNVADQIDWITGDLLSTEILYDAAAEADVVIHAAALVSFAAADRNDLYEINVLGTQNLVNASLDGKVEQFIHISSVGAIAKTTGGQPISEDTPWTDDRHTSDYGRSKHLGEMEVWRGNAEGLPATILNPTIVLGAGPWHSSSCKIFMEIYEGLKFYTPGSTGYIDVRDVARIAVDLISDPRPGENFIISEGNYKFKDLFEWIAKGLDRKPPTISPPRWAARSLALADGIKSKITGQRPIITRDTVRNAYEDFSYDTTKIKELGYDFIPIRQTVAETTALLKEAAEENFAVKLLPYQTRKKRKE